MVDGVDRDEFIDKRRSSLIPSFLEIPAINGFVLSGHAAPSFGGVPDYTSDLYCNECAAWTANGMRVAQAASRFPAGTTPPPRTDRSGKGGAWIWVADTMGVMDRDYAVCHRT